MHESEEENHQTSFPACKTHDFHRKNTDITRVERYRARRRAQHARGLPDGVAGFKNDNDSSQNRPVF